MAFSDEPVRQTAALTSARLQVYAWSLENFAKFAKSALSSEDKCRVTEDIFSTQYVAYTESMHRQTAWVKKASQ